MPPKEDVLRVLLAAELEVQDYLWTIALTLGRVGEINRLTWQDVNFAGCFVILYTRKKKGGHLTPRKVRMIDKLYDSLQRRHENRHKELPFVFWHRYWSRKNRDFVVGPYTDRNSIMKSLCDKADVKYFRFHAFRHFGASVLEQAGVPIGTIQSLLGHESRRTTEIYLHSIGENERQAMDVLGELYRDFSKPKPHTEPHTNKKRGNQ